MKTLLVLFSLFVAHASFAATPQLVCRTKHFGYDHRQISVYLYQHGNEFDANVMTTSTTGIFEPLFFKRLHVYGMNGSVSYVSQRPEMSIAPRFMLVVYSNKQAKLGLGTGMYYDMTCMNPRTVIAY